MIAALARDLAVRLKARGFPVDVRVGRDYPGRGAYASNVIMLDRDRVKGDAVLPVKGSDRNPRRGLTRALGVVADFYVQSTLPGARLHEHEHLCDDIVDGFLSELAAWVTEACAGDLLVAESRYLAPEEVTGAEVGAGVVYRLGFALQRGVTRVTFAGEGQPTAAPSRVGTSTRVSADGTNYEDI